MCTLLDKERHTIRLLRGCPLAPTLRNQPIQGHVHVVCYLVVLSSILRATRAAHMGPTQNALPTFSSPVGPCPRSRPVLPGLAVP